MSPVKIEANRQNATLSTGPTSPQGKAISSRNAISHGLTARQSVLPHEDLEEYREFVADYTLAYLPTNRLDHALTIELADLRWRLRRVPILETQLLNREILELQDLPENAKYGPYEIMAMAFARLVNARILTNLFAQEGRLQGRVHRIQKHLEALQRMQSRPMPCPLPPRMLARMERPTVAPQPVEPPEEESAQEMEICKNQPIHVPLKPGRNEPCPCGSGVKFKRCCLNRPQNSKTLAAAA